MARLLIKLENPPPPKETAQIPLGDGMFALVDKEDFENLNKYTWFAKKSNVCYYAVRVVKSKNSSYLVRMHRQITHCPNNLVVHHKHGNSLDNRKENLQPMTEEQHRAFHPHLNFP